MTVPGWSASSTVCAEFGAPSTTQSFQASLSSASGGSGLLTLDFSGGSVAGPVSSTGANELQLDLTAEPGIATQELNLSGYGSTFTGTVELIDPTCTYTSSSATLTLAGTGLTMGAHVSVALNPDTVNVCSSSCSSVRATATVTNAASGQPAAGQSVSFSSSDPDVGVGPVTDHGDGTYTASLEPSGDPGDVTITATDDSVNPPAIGSTTLHQVCQTPGTVSDVRAPRASVASGAQHCTLTTANCPNVDFGVAADCLITVTDTAKHPTLPTGQVKITVWANRSSGYRQVSGSCTLGNTPGNSPKSSQCLADVVALPGRVDLLAQYAGDAKHSSSLAATNFTVTPNVSPLLSLKHDLINVGGTLQVVGSVNILAGKAEIGTFVGAPPGAITLTAGEIEAAAGTVIYYMGNWLNDPPDHAYRVVAKVRIPRTPDVPVGNMPLERTERSLLANSVAMGAIGPVLHTTLDRAVSAAAAGDFTARTAQVKAAIMHIDRLAALVDSDISLQRRLAGQLRHAHLGTVSTPKSRLVTLRAGLVRQLPAQMLHLFNQLGLTGAQIAQFRRTIAKSPLPKTENIAATLVSPSLIANEKKVAAGLRRLASDPAPDAFPKPAVLP